MARTDPEQKNVEGEGDPRSLVDQLQGPAIEEVVADVRDELGAMTAEDPEEQWFEPEDLARRTRVELREERGLLRSLEADDHPSTEPVSGLRLGTLPGWPGAGPFGAGLGPEADEILGPIRNGDILMIDADRLGVSDALVLQLLEAILRGSTHDRGDSVVGTYQGVVLHGEGGADLSLRRRARWGDVALDKIREGAGTRDPQDGCEDTSWSSQLSHVPPGVMYGDELMEQLVRDVERWTPSVAGDPAQVVVGLTGLAVWERYQDSGRIPDEEESAWLMQLLRTARGRGWVVIAAIRSARGAATFRRACDEGLVRATLSIETLMSELQPATGESAAGESVTVVVRDQRDGAAPRRLSGFRWDWRHGRMWCSRDRGGVEP